MREPVLARGPNGIDAKNYETIENPIKCDVKTAAMLLLPLAYTSLFVLARIYYTINEHR